MEQCGMHRYAGWLAVAVVLAGAMIVAGMFTYPIPYSWAEHFLSAMGLTRLEGGESNLFTSMLFNAALTLSGLMSGFYFCLRGYCGRPRIIGWLLIASGVVGGAALMGIGFTPYNLFPDLHNQCTYIASGGLGIAIVWCAGLKEDVFSSHTENFLWLLFAFFILMIWTALTYLRAHSMLPWTPTAQVQQKMMVGFFWLYMLWNSLSLYCRTKRK